MSHLQALNEESWSPAGDLPAHVLEHVEFTNVGAVIKASLPIESWSLLVTHLGRLERALPWWIGDALVFGEHTYGSKYADAAEATGRKLQTLKNYAWVARSVPVENRDPELPWRVYREVARLKRAEQRKWLARTKKNTWDTDRLRQAIVADGHRRRPTPGFKPTTSDEQSHLDRNMVRCPRCNHRFEP